jgi:putative transposase
VSVTIRQHNECFYACFLVEITEEEFFRTHPRYASQPQGESVGIDLGIKGLAVTSDGLVVDNPHQWKQQLEHENHLQERMNRCGGIKQKKRERKSFRPSKRFIKAKMKLCKQRTYIRNCRQDLRNKLCGAILSSYQHIAIETLSIKRMPDSLNSRRNKKLIRNFLKEVGLYEIRRRLQTLGELIGRDVVAAPNNFYSTRTCCKCGHIEPHLNLDKRIYHCPECGNEIDRDLNAAINLRNLIGRGMSDSLPEASPMRSELIKSQIKHGVIGNGK